MVLPYILPYILKFIIHISLISMPIMYFSKRFSKSKSSIKLMMGQLVMSNPLDYKQNIPDIQMGIYQVRKEK